MTTKYIVGSVDYDTGQVRYVTYGSSNICINLTPVRAKAIRWDTQEEAEKKGFYYPGVLPGACIETIEI